MAFSGFNVLNKLTFVYIKKFLLYSSQLPFRAGGSTEITAARLTVGWGSGESWTPKQLFTQNQRLCRGSTSTAERPGSQIAAGERAEWWRLCIVYGLLLSSALPHLTLRNFCSVSHQSSMAGGGRWRRFLLLSSMHASCCSHTDGRVIEQTETNKKNVITDFF